MYMLVAQEHHLWLNLAEMRDFDKIYFLDAPMSQNSLFSDIVKDIAQHFSVE